MKNIKIALILLGLMAIGGVAHADTCVAPADRPLSCSHGTFYGTPNGDQWAYITHLRDMGETVDVIAGPDPATVPHDIGAVDNPVVPTTDVATTTDATTTQATTTDATDDNAVLKSLLLQVIELLKQEIAMKIAELGQNAGAATTTPVTIDPVATTTASTIIGALN